MDITPYIVDINKFNSFEPRAGSYVETYSCDVLTYIVTLKNASTFFREIFKVNHRWPPTTFNEINWEGCVFSFISDPLTRRYKAITQWLYENSLANQFYIDSNLQQLVLNSKLLDFHSVSISENLGKYCNQIDWIPIDIISPDQVIQLTDMLLKKYNIHMFRNVNNTNETSKKKKALELKIKEMFEENPNQEVLNYLAADIELYSQVVAKFNPTGNNWDEVSWLRK